MRIVYLTPALHTPGGMERVLSVKANYLVDVMGYDVYIVITEGKGTEPFYPLSKRIIVVQLDICFDEIYKYSIIRKSLIYLKKQRIFKQRLRDLLLELKPDITVSLLRRDINFINDIQDGSVKIGEIHNNRLHYRNFESNETSFVKRIFERLWMRSLVTKLRRLTRFVVLSQEDSQNWKELDNVTVINNPISFTPDSMSTCENHRVIAVGRYAYQKGIDLLLEAWAHVEPLHDDWELYVYGGGDSKPYEGQMRRLGLKHCHLEPPTKDIVRCYLESSIFVLSSRFEGFPMVLPEAMACGLPCVAFTCPCGTKDAVTDGVDGLWIENGNTEKLAEGICRLIENPQERIRMGEAAARNVERLRLDQVMKRWVALFEEVSHGKEM